MIGLDPDLIFRSSGDRAEINRRPRPIRTPSTPCPGDRSRRCERCSPRSRIDMPPACRRCRRACSAISATTWCGAWSACAPAKPDPIGVPEALLIRPTVMVVFDAARDEMSIVTPVRPAPGVSARAAYESAHGAARRAWSTRWKRRSITRRARRRSDGQRGRSASRTRPRPNTWRWSPGRKDYIAAGDAFQIVLSQRFTSRFDLPAVRALSGAAAGQPVALSLLPRFRRLPDRLLQPGNPGARARGQGRHPPDRRHAAARRDAATEDAALGDELLADPKERAEHLMLLDLGRNDVGRVAKIGTVKVTDSFFIERYSHVMHIVSNVEGELRDELDALDALAAGFPAGTVSGAPKVRAMQIIDELEKDKRGIYAGCIGYFGAGGEMDTCIVLRASVVKDGLMHVQAGAGIVYDSSPAAEQKECVDKARALVPSRGGSGPVRGSWQARAVGAPKR